MKGILVFFFNCWTWVLVISIGQVLYLGFFYYISPTWVLIGLRRSVFTNFRAFYSSFGLYDATTNLVMIYDEFYE